MKLICKLCTLEKKHVFFYCWEECSVDVCLVQLVQSHTSSPFTYLYSVLLYLFLKVGYWSLLLLLCSCLFFPSILSLLASWNLEQWCFPYMFSISLNLLSFFVCPNLCSILKNTHVYLRRMCILLLLSGMFCICLLDQFGLKYTSIIMFLHWFSICMTHPLSKLR